MSDFYVDSNTGSNGDNGTTQALAWATIEYAVETGGISAGDDVWVRRTHAEYSGDPTSNITPASAGTRSAHKSVIGWPRAALPDTTITSASWTNGSTTVDLVVGVTLSREAHCGRWVTAPNGSKFLITQITDSNTLIIDREYSGATVTLTNGKFQIDADEDYSDRPADVDGWDSDADALPVIDFRNTSYIVDGSSVIYWGFKNLEFRDSAYALGTLYTTYSQVTGCLFHQDNDAAVCYLPGCYIDRCIFEGSASGSSQRLRLGVIASFKNSAVYNMGDAGIYGGSGYFENVNVGVEAVNVGADFAVLQGIVYGRDIKLGSTTPFDLASPQFILGASSIRALKIENYQKMLGNHKTFAITQVITSKDVVAGSGDPYKRSGGADKIIEIDCTDSDGASVPERALIVIEHEFETGVSSKSYRYYVQCKDLSLIASELWLEVEYVDSYDDTSEYTITKEVSDETCSLRSGVSDWTQYIEVTGIAPAVASKVRIRCFVAKYDADGYIYIDPQAVVT